MSNQNPIWPMTSFALCSIIATSILPARAIDYFNVKSQANSSYIAQNKTAQELLASAQKKKKLRDYQGALTDLNQAIELNPKFAGAYNNRALLKSEGFQDFQGALVDFNKAIELDPKFATAYDNRAVLKARELQDVQGALADSNKAIELNPNDATAYQHRAYLKDLTGGQDRGKALLL